MAGRSARRGFTLVEVIVVLVILAILAAIAIPALTGYIDKAEDKKYIADARNRIVAFRSVLNEAYAQGDFNGNNTAQEYLLKGTSLTDYTLFDMELVGGYVFAPTNPSKDMKRMTYHKRAAELIGEPVLPPLWNFFTVRTNTADTTAITADGFCYYYMPKGYLKGALSVWVTYKMNRINNPSTSHDVFYNQIIGTSNNTKYNDSAGYEVYYTNL
jgi:prepilin-type N-terminal cleavage/methylation domain-containing protein